MSNRNDASKPQSIGQYLIRLGGDLLLWAFALVAMGFLSGAGLIDSAPMAVAGAALLLAIRANTKAEVNSAHNNKKSLEA